jgi:hypothetical protein
MLHNCWKYILSRILGFACLIKQVLDLMIEFTGPLYNLLQQFINHFLRLNTLYFWPHYTNPLLWNYSDFQMTFKFLFQSHIATDRQSWCRSPAQSFSGPSPLGLATIFYCLRFDTSIFIASYDSQGHGGGIQPRLHTGRTSSYCWLLVI